MKLTDSLQKKIKTDLERKHTHGFGDDATSTLTLGDVLELVGICQTALTGLEEMTRKAEKHERREDQFRTWWAGVSDELRQLKQFLVEDGTS